VPCTKYHYGVKVTIDSQQSDIVEAAEEIVTSLDDSVPYVVPNKEVIPSTEDVEISWDHATCISSYKVKVCKAPEDCTEEELEMGDPSQHNVTHIVAGLEPCTSYSVAISATTEGKELEADSTHFDTESPPASAPANLAVKLTGDMSDISFDSVQCATGYTVYRELEGGETEDPIETEATSLMLQSPEPCESYSYSVTATVGEEESERASVEGTVPPRNGHSSAPQLEVFKKENFTVELILTAPEFNHKCQVEEYHVKYGIIEVNDETMFHATDLQDGKIVLDDVSGADDSGLKFEARIKYLDGTFSPWRTEKPNDPGIQGPTTSTSLLVPVVIGVLVAVVVLVIIIFFIIRSKRNRNKYDAEKAESSDESKRLKDNPEA
jgi:hypothetical protein